MPRYLVLDTETTGLVDPGVAEIGWSEIEEDLNVVSEFSSIVNPMKPMEPGASAVNAITDEMLVDAPKIHELPWIDGEVVLICHNTKFDRPLVEPYMNIVDEICTMRLARRLLPNAESHKLSVLNAYCELPPSLGHRANLDVRMVIGILDYMIEGLALSGHNMTLLEIVEWLKVPRRFKTMPYGKFRGTPIDKVSWSYLRWLKAQSGHDPDMELTLSHI